MEKLHPTTTKTSTAQLDGGSNSHVFTGIKMFSYIRSVQYNAQMINDSKSPAKGFGLVIITIKKHYYTTIAIILYPTKPTKHNNSNYTQALQ